MESKTARWMPIAFAGCLLTVVTDMARADEKGRPAPASADCTGSYRVFEDGEELTIVLEQSGKEVTGKLIEKDGATSKIKARRDGNEFRGILYWDGYEVTLKGRLDGERLRCALSYGIFYSKKVVLDRVREIAKS